eukprot:1499136-Rhodomonas_salina.1
MRLVTTVVHKHPSERAAQQGDARRQFEKTRFRGYRTHQPAGIFPSLKIDQPQQACAAVSEPRGSKPNSTQQRARGTE